MELDISSLPDDVADLKDIVASLVASHKDLEDKYRLQIDYLQEQIRLLKNELFGRKTEKRSPADHYQLLLFNQAEQAEAADVSEKIVIAQHSRKKTGRKPLPKDLPRVEVIHDLAEDEKICDCGSHLSRIGEQVCEKLDIIPAKVRVIRHIRYKYACKSCEGVDSEGPSVKIAAAPLQLIAKSIATPGLLTHLLVSKFEDALPFYRQEKILARMGIELGRATMCNWAVKVAERIEPLMALLHKEIRCGPLINIDETPLQVLNEAGRANTSKSYMWVYRGGDPQKPVLIYQYQPTRSGQVPLKFLDGYRGYVQSDAYSGYDTLGRQPGIELVGCWAHVRRKFMEVINAKSNLKKQGHAEQALDYIGQLYALEKHADENKFSPDQRFDLRQHNAKAILTEFKDWLTQTSLITPPKGLLGKAVNYTLRNWNRLVRYIDDGHLRPDNNLAENAIRPFVLGRKNWLFSGHPNGAQASATIFSLIETAKANGLKPYEYFRYLFDKLPCAESENDYKNLLPQNIEASLLPVS
ncbi:MAG: IS66 family transposase [Desulfobacterales bacterium]|nr:MAG: IS66 family transposase [Desulfobacterales bacterium]